MIELINTTEQTVAAGGIVTFNETAAHSGCAERHRGGSGQITLIKPGRYLVMFSGNVAVPTGGTVGEVALALNVDGEALGGTVMRATPAAVAEYFNVSVQRYVDVYCNCCTSIAIENIGATPILVENANLTAVRVA